MNTLEALDMSLDLSARQLIKVMEGWPESHSDSKLVEESMSASGMLEHCLHVYSVILTTDEISKYDWSAPWTSGHETLSEKVAAIMPAIEAFKARLREIPMEKAAFLCYELGGLHTCYHVGQLCLLRMRIEPGWDPYAIYAD